MARILILGGTSEASAIARRLVEDTDAEVTTSFAGRIATARAAAGETRIGGFGGVAGLVDHLTASGVDLLIDATHPFAAHMRWNAREAADVVGIPTIRVERPRWSEGPGDDWRRVPDLDAAAHAVADLSRVFLTIGRTELDAFAVCTETWFLVRTVEPATDLPGSDSLGIEARGPFTVEGERALLTDHEVEAIVTKDSGGEETRAKLAVARDLGLPVIVVDRPPNPPGPRVETVDEILAWVDRHR